MTGLGLWRSGSTLPRTDMTRKRAKMFKRFIHIIMITMALAPRTATAGLLSRLGVGLNPGTLLALRGDYSSSAKLKDMVLPGAGLGLSLRYRLNKNFFIDGSFSYNWMFFQQNKRPSEYVSDKPAFVAPMYTLNGTFYPMSGHTIEPYLTAGGGICPWWFSSQATGGVLWLSPGNPDEAFTKVSKLIEGGLGIEVMIWSKFSILGEVKYYHIFAKDEYKFGKGYFGDQDLLGIRLGITFYFSSKNPAQKDEGNTP
jgi:hypothetical protein